jgi:hypothetical protein
MTTGEQTPVLLYQPPSPEYLVAMLNEMRDASSRAQQAFVEYHNGKARIEAEIRGEGLDRAYSEELMRRMYEERSQTEMHWLVDQYTYWREKAVWHAACLTAENLTLDVLGGQPPSPGLVPEPTPVVPELNTDIVLKDQAGSDDSYLEMVDKCPTCGSRKKSLRRKDRGVRCSDSWHDEEDSDAPATES